MMETGYPITRIGDVAHFIGRPEPTIAGITFRQIGVRLWGVGAYERDAIDGSETKYKSLSRVESGDIIVNKIWARNGSVAVITDELAGCYGSGEFPTFAPSRDKLDPKWFHWITKAKWFWNACDEKSQGTSGKNRIKPENFLDIEIPLPSLGEQHRIVAHIEALAGHISEIEKLRELVEEDIQQMLLSAFQKTMDGAIFKPMKDVAPIIRRKIVIDFLAEYPELGIRSFGKGTFHKPALDGFEVGSKKLYEIKAGDLMFSNVFAWEGAIAVSKPEDDGRFGSHRFISCVPKPGQALAPFLCFYFLTNEGLEKIRDASPGGAGRNRTLGLRKLEAIQVPVPDYDKQLWFQSLLDHTNQLRWLQAESQTELDALLPSVLDKAFKGEL